MIDTHCHINFFKNAGDVALNCEKRKVNTIYVTTLPSQFKETYKYIEPLKYVNASLGFHCLESNYNLEEEKKIFLSYIDKTKFIGEVGLDFSKRAITSREKQIEVFEFILKSIKDKNKIINLHSASAEDDVLKMIVKYKIKKAIFHWYSGKIGTLNQILGYGYYFSINESMCKSKKGQNIISKLPKDRVLIETDAPFIKDVLPYKNYYVYSYLSDLWQLNIDEIINLIHTNFNQLKEFKNNRNNLLDF